MAKEPIRISENEITGVAPITVYENSTDSLFLKDRRQRVLRGTILSQYDSSGYLGRDGDYWENPKDPEDPKTYDIPQLEDITVLKSEVYKNALGVSRARLIIRVKNSSGKKLNDVDYRRSI